MANPVTTSDYKSTSIQGKQRIFAGKFDNPMGGAPSVSFDEELITYDSVSDTTFRNPAGNCSARLIDGAKELPLKSPADDSVITAEMFIGKLTAQGKVTDEDFFILFYSLGRRAQLARDTFILAQRAQAEAQAVYDAETSEANLAALNAAIADTEAARGEM